ncbi:guanylate-binding protein [Powellomyces hirtus]|nr:guanylate-binding protein [Powellomyces hirtus]
MGSGASSCCKGRRNGVIEPDLVNPNKPSESGTQTTVVPSVSATQTNGIQKTAEMYTPDDYIPRMDIFSDVPDAPPLYPNPDPSDDREPSVKFPSRSDHAGSVPSTLGEPTLEKLHEAPVQFIINTVPKQSTPNWIMTEESIKILKSISLPVVVITVMGIYRFGKSFLMNQLAGVQDGFDLGSTTVGKTRGFWLWAFRQRDPDRIILLLDCEGLSDAKRSPEYSMQLFTIGMLLSSCLMMNTTGSTINTDDLAKLSFHSKPAFRFVSNLSDHIRVSTSKKADTGADIDQHTPCLIWVLRDAFLSMKDAEHRDLTEDELLETAMVALRKHVFEFATVKTMISSTSTDVVTITGRDLVLLAEVYLKVINEGKAPCIGDAWQAVSERSCQAALDEAVRSYKIAMETFVIPELPIEADCLLQHHKSYEDTAVKIFHELAVGAMSAAYLQKLQKTLASYEEGGAKLVSGEYASLCERNVKASKAFCEKTMDTLYQPHQAKVEGKKAHRRKYNAEARGPMRDLVRDQKMEILQHEETAQALRFDLSDVMIKAREAEWKNARTVQTLEKQKRATQKAIQNLEAFRAQQLLATEIAKEKHEKDMAAFREEMAEDARLRETQQKLNHDLLVAVQDAEAKKKEQELWDRIDAQMGPLAMQNRFAKEKFREMERQHQKTIEELRRTLEELRRNKSDPNQQQMQNLLVQIGQINPNPPTPPPRYYGPPVPEPGRGGSTNTVSGKPCRQVVAGGGRCWRHR